MALIPGLTFKKIFKGIGSLAGGVLGIGRKKAEPAPAPQITVQAPPSPTPTVSTTPFLIGGAALIVMIFFMMRK